MGPDVRISRRPLFWYNIILYHAWIPTSRPDGRFSE